MSAKSNTRQFTRISLLAAIVVVLQVISSNVKFGPVSITLALAPIIIGAALYGPRAGAFLGGILGAVVFVAGMFGWDGGFVMMLWAQNPITAIIMCFVKTIAAGFLAGVVYRALLKAKVSPLVAVIAAGIVCPVVNTGLFIAGMFVFYLGLLQDFAAAEGQNIVNYVIIAFVGVNFIVELITNMIFASAITRIVEAAKKN